ncbi:MAG: FtsX-like permease family protein [Opitutaceae bacterium]
MHDHLLSGYITLAPPASADTPELRGAHRRQLVEQIEARLAALPGVDGVAFTRALPTWGYPGSAQIAIAGQPLAAPGRAPSASIAPVSPAFFDLFGIRLLQGRTFNASDRADSPPVVVINETMARTLWPGKSPLGERIGGTDPARPDWCEIVGVVADTRSFDIGETGNRFQTYRPWAQFTLGGGAIVLRSQVNPEALAPAVRATIAQIAPDLPVRNIGAVATEIDRNFANLRLAGWMLVAFALLGLLLAAIGIYGVLAHQVQQRTNEIGIRMALGAQVRDVFTLVLGQGLRLTLIGAAIGLAGAFAVGRVLASIMPGLPAENLLTAATVTALLVGVALLACWLPARRAAKVDPMVALRAE